MKTNPRRLKKRIIVPILKKETKKYVATTEELHNLAKVSKYERILANKLIKIIDKKLNEEQYAFRQGWSTVDLIFTVRQIIEKQWQFGKNIIMIFIDLEKAYDNVRRDKVWEALINMQVGYQSP